MSFVDRLVSILQNATVDINTVIKDMHVIKTQMFKLSSLDGNVFALSGKCEENANSITELKKTTGVIVTGNDGSSLNKRISNLEGLVGQGPSDKCEERFTKLENRLNRLN